MKLALLAFLYFAEFVKNSTSRNSLLECQIGVCFLGVEYALLEIESF